MRRYGPKRTRHLDKLETLEYLSSAGLVAMGYTRNGQGNFRADIDADTTCAQRIVDTLEILFPEAVVTIHFEASRPPFQVAEDRQRILHIAYAFNKIPCAEDIAAAVLENISEEEEVLT